MDNIRVLLANEPKAYREAMAAALGQLRSDVDVTVVEPEELVPVMHFDKTVRGTWISPRPRRVRSRRNPL